MRKKTRLTASFISMLLLSALAGTQLVNFGTANPYHHIYVYDGEVSPSANAKPTLISVFFPENGTVYPASNIPVILNVSIGGDANPPLSPFLLAIYYKADWQSDNTYAYEFVPGKYPYNPSEFNGTSYPTIFEFSSTLNLTGIPEGNRTIVVTAVEWRATDIRIGGHAANALSYVYYYKSSTVNGSTSILFTIDNTSPSVSVTSLENKTYYASDLALNFTVNEPVRQIKYSLDGQGNVTVAGNSTLTSLPVGGHYVTVYAWDAAGNVGASKTIYFSIEEPFPTTLVIAPIASVSVLGAGLSVYFKKRKHLATAFSLDKLLFRVLINTLLSPFWRALAPL